jgi:cysteine synthase B
MLLDGMKTGELAKGKTIIDATSGNTGIAYAMFGAMLGYPVKIFLPQNASDTRKQLITRYGAEIIETSPLEGSDGAYVAAQHEALSSPQSYFFPDQYNNEANSAAHYHGTGQEIWQQTNGTVSHFLAITGTAGTFTGTARRLKEENPNIRTVAVQPNSPFHGIEGTRHIASTLHPGKVLDKSLWDDTVEVSTDEAYAMARLLAKEEGILVGISAGANVAASLKYASSLPPDATVVTILCDTGTRYIHDALWTQGEP